MIVLWARDINSIFDALEEFTDLAQWHFLFATAD
jgi:hypothetical protein